MAGRRRFVMDRRNGTDRRAIYYLDYFLNGGVERRCFKNRRGEWERRTGWIRVGEWLSVQEHAIRDGE